jgi:hypothetical protein
MNTTDGVIGILSGKVGTLGDGTIRQETARFNFLVISKKGNVYSYFNRKKRAAIEHYVTTGNSNTFLYDFSFRDGNDVIFRKTIRNNYCDNKFKTWLYKADGSDAPEFHIFGRNYPNKLVCKDFIGYSGVGYLHTDEGLYIMCEMRKGDNNFEMRSMEDTDACFDPTDFKLVEQEMNTVITESLQREKEKLDGRTYSGDCADAKTILNNYKKQLNAKKKLDLEQTQQGNVYQNQNTQKAYANLMDPIDMVQESILDTDVKICNTQKRLSNARGVSAEKAAEKLECLQQQKSRLINAKAQMEALNITYQTEPAKALVEKNRILMANMRTCQ